MCELTHSSSRSGSAYKCRASQQKRGSRAGSSSAPVVELVSRVTTFQLCALTPTVAQQRMAPLNRSILGGGKQGRAVAGWVSTPITQAAVCDVGVGEQTDGQAHRHMCM